MKATGKRVGSTALLVKLATGMQSRKDQLGNRCLFSWVHACRNAPAIILDRNAAILMLDHLDVLAMTGKRFVCGIVDDLLDDMKWVLGARIHPRTLPNGLQAL